MSTRGYMGIQKRGQLKGSYNHYDSYFEGLGKDIIKSINKIPKNERITELHKIFDRIELVNENSVPTQSQRIHCIGNSVVDTSVGEHSFDDWYCLLRRTQGNLDVYIESDLKYMLNGNDFLNDELFCEYAYIINLDTNKLEVYENGKSILIMEGSLDKLNYYYMLKKYTKYHDKKYGD